MRSSYDRTVFYASAWLEPLQMMKFRLCQFQKWRKTVFSSSSLSMVAFNFRYSSIKTNECLKQINRSLSQNPQNIEKNMY